MQAHFNYKLYISLVAIILMVMFMPKHSLSQNCEYDSSERHHLILVFDNSLSPQAASYLLGNNYDGQTVKKDVSSINKKYRILRDSNDFYSIINYAVGDLMSDFSQVARPSLYKGKPFIWQPYDAFSILDHRRSSYSDIVYYQGHNRAANNSNGGTYSWNSGIQELSLNAARKPSNLEIAGAEKTYMIIFRDRVSAGGNFQLEAQNIFGSRVNELQDSYNKLYNPIHQLYTFRLITTLTLINKNPVYAAELYEVCPAHCPSLGAILTNGPHLEAKQTHKGYRIELDCRVIDSLKQKFRILDAQLSVAETTHHRYANPDTIHLSVDFSSSNVVNDSIAATLSCRVAMLDTVYGGMIATEKTGNCSDLCLTMKVPMPKNATIFGFPMPLFMWLWCPNDAHKAAQWWQWILIVLVVLTVAIIVRNRIKRNSVFHPSDKDISLVASEQIAANTLSFPVGNPTAVPMTLGSYLIKVKKPKQRYFNVNKKPQASLSIKVENISWNTQNEIIYDASKLFSLKANGHSNFNKFTVSIDDYSTGGIDLVINPSALTDIKRPQESVQRCYQLTAKLSLCNDNGKAICQLPLDFIINIERIKPKVTVEIELDDPYNTEGGFQFDATKGSNTTIGQLIIRNESSLKYCPNTVLNIQYKIKKDGDSSGKEVSAIQINGLNPAEPISINMQNGKVIKCPIVADFPTLGNPMGEQDTYSIETTLTSHFVGCDNEKVDSVEKKNWTVLANVDEIALRVSVRTGQNTERIKDGDKKELPSLKFTPDGGGLKMGYAIYIENMAQNGYDGTGIIVKELSQTVDIYPKLDGADAVSIDYSSADLNKESVFDLTGDHVQALKNGVLLQCTHDERRNRHFNIGFCTNDIRHIRHQSGGERLYFMTVRHTIKFKYFIDRTGNGTMNPSEYTEYKFALEYRVEQAPYPEWLAVDFGTSAIVARYGDKDGVVDLHTQKDNYLKKLNDPDTVHEPGTPFLSSNAAMRGNVLENYRHGKSQLLQDYDVTQNLPNIDLLTVSLSATPRTEDSNIEYLLPTLKQLVGYEMLPNINIYENLTYNYLDAETKAIVESARVYDSNTNTSTKLAQIPTVLTEIYAQLFRYYIGPALGDRRLDQLNKIVLTIPNTFTPNHIRSVKDVVLKSMSQFEIREIRFVSESDAVACFYEGHRGELRSRAFTKEVEHILVYDMGAGTLDLTYFQSRTAIDGTRELSSLGRIGVSKAGNYLDALLAECLANRFEVLNGLTWENQITSSSDLLQARRMKEFIKDKVKPKIGNVDQLRIGVKEGKLIGLNITEDTDLNMAEVFTETAKFKDYLDECTNGIIDKFFKMLGETQPKVDTLLLSGRSARLHGIKEHLINALEGYGVISDDLEVLDLCQNGNENLTKTAVAQGAEYYARVCAVERQNAAIVLQSKYISACYGLLYQGNNGMMYTELLNPYKEKPINEHIKDGIHIQVYAPNEKTLDLRWTGEIILVQTYSDNTAIDWENGRTEYISEMARYRVDSLPDRRNARISLKVDESGRMEINIAGVGNATMNPARIDIQSDSNRMSLWPMLS